MGWFHRVGVFDRSKAMGSSIRVVGTLSAECFVGGGAVYGRGDALRLGSLRLDALVQVSPLLLSGQLEAATRPIARTTASGQQNGVP